MNKEEAGEGPELRSFHVPAIHPFIRSSAAVVTMKTSFDSGSPSARTRLTVPKVARPETIHVFLEMRDAGVPNLREYRRAMIHIAP